MKTKDFKKGLKTKSEEELKTMLIERRRKLQSLKFDLIAGKVKNVKQIKNIKKDIARILTILNSKKIKIKK